MGWTSLKDGMIPELCRGDHIGGKTTFEETIIGQSASMTLDLIIEENNAKGLFSGRKQDHNVIKAACIGEM